MTNEPLSLAHQDLLESKLKQLPVDISEYAFANLYLFRHVHHYELLNDSFLFIKGTTRDGFSYFMPTTPLDQLPEALLIQLLKSAELLFPIPEKWLSSLNPRYFEWFFNENDSDYIYSQEKMRHYPGRHLSSKRNFLHQFNNLYQANFLPYQAKYFNDALLILDEWQKEIIQPLSETDYYSCLEALQLFDRLHLQGYLLYVDQEPGGFIIGEPLHSKLYGLHFAKARKEFKGIYPYLYQAFARSLPDHYSEWNMEQDLGVETVRKSKLSYHPDRLIKKWRVRFRSDFV